MNHPIILDACTIINLLRIDDEDDEFLYKKMVSLNLYLTESVYKEINLNYNKNDISSKREEYIKMCINNLYIILSQKQRLYNDQAIIDNISNEVFNELKRYSGHKKKDNGELLSTALGLLVSRKELNRVYFYTDDIRAKEQFMPYYAFQQIGTILDSVDLLTFLFWCNQDFGERQLSKYLSELWSDICQPLRLMVGEIEKIRNGFSSIECRDRQLEKNVNQLIDGYYKFDIKRMMESVDYFTSNKKNIKIKQVIDKYSSNIILCPLMYKIKKTRDDLNKYVLYKMNKD
jgi:hypothetical protein